MVKLDKIYTKTGDLGQTSLANGQTRAKDDKRVAAYGSVDEANATIGIARYYVRDNETLYTLLGMVQNDLFDLGADLARPFGDDKPAWRIVAHQVARLEHDIDRLNENLAPLSSFILPGGSQAACYLHLARTVTRRAERDIVALKAVEAINDLALCYINRLSDLLFVAARMANDGAKQDVLWQPGKYR